MEQIARKTGVLKRQEPGQKDAFPRLQEQGRVIWSDIQ